MSNNFLGSTVSNSDISTETTQGQILDKLNAGLTITGATTTTITDIDTSGGGQTSNLNVSEQNANFANAMLALDTGTIAVTSGSTLNVSEQNANFANAMLALDTGTIDIGNFPATQNVDITAQTVGNINCDIAGQTVPNLQCQSNNLNLATQATSDNIDTNTSSTNTKLDNVTRFDRLKIMNPRKLFSGHFILDDQQQWWTYDLDTSFTTTHDAFNRELDINVPNTAFVEFF